MLGKFFIIDVDVMWFFSEFLPEIIYSLNKVNKSIKNTTIFILFFINIFYIGYGYLFGFNLYMSLTFISILMVSIIIFNKNSFLKRKSNYVVLESQLKNEDYKIFIEYKHLISNNVFNVSDVNIRVFMYPLWGGTFIEINDIKVNNLDNLSIYERIVKGVIFRQYIKDIDGKDFLCTVSIHGFLKPYILVCVNDY